MLLSELQSYLTFTCTVLPVLHLCHLISHTHYETDNSSIAGMEMRIIITRPKVATRKLLLAPRSAARPKDVATVKSSQGGSQRWSYNVPKWQCCVGTEKHHSHLSTFSSLPPPWWYLLISPHSRWDSSTSAWNSNSSISVKAGHLMSSV